MMNKLTAFFIGACTSLVSITANAEGALDWATGSWGVDVENVPEGLNAEELDAFRGCQTSPVKITVDKETMRYKAIHTGEGDFTSTSPILDVEDRWITLQYDGETRVLKNGNLQKWHMFFVSPDRFYWVAGEGVWENQRDFVVPVARVRCQFKGV